MWHKLLVITLLPVILCAGGCGKESSSKQSSKTPSSSKANKPTKARPELPISPRYQGAQQVRLDDTYAVVILADGRKTLVPLGELEPGDLAWLTKLSKQSPFTTSGKSSVVVVESTDPELKPKKTIEVAKIEGSLETVQLCPPNVGRNQIGGTCMLYARVHWLDIAGFYVDLPTIYKIINDTPTDRPWLDPKYVIGLDSIMTGFKTETITHDVPPEAEPFEWAREELRRGRPLPAAFPREIWQALPPGFIAAHPWNGGSVGHQIVINGFTWNKETNQGTFHIVNSWNELMEFVLTTQAAQGGALVIEKSLSPVGEIQPKKIKEVVEKITYLKTVGTTNLYEVTTNLRVRKIAAPDKAAVVELIEAEK